MEKVTANIPDMATAMKYALREGGKNEKRGEGEGREEGREGGKKGGRVERREGEREEQKMECKLVKDKAGWREARVFLRGTKEEDRNGSTCEEHGEEEEGLASPGIREGSN